MNKYENISNELREHRKRDKMCNSKVKFGSMKEAQFNSNQEVYHCPYCNCFHRSSRLLKLISKVKTKKRK